MRYIKRPLSQAIASSMQKVVIVEGARAVGKTSLVREELMPLGFKYHTLADSTTYELAKEDSSFWLNSIGHPAIIDEAQRIPGLTMAIKEYVDAQMHPGVYFVLTGSASIGKAGLDGQDPLTRRSQRFSLNPLTQREIVENPRNLVDELWDGQVNNDYYSELSESQLGIMLSVGGFPYYVDASLAGKLNEIGHQIRSDITNILGDTLLPEERFDRTVAQAVLTRLLSLPGDILNMSNIGKVIGCDNRTVERYVSIFSNRFLIRHLPNLRTPPQKQNFTRAKIHPVDVSFSVETLREQGVDPLRDRAQFGKLLESYVVSQIVPAAQWAEHKADSYYWREPGKDPKEVDLVLLYDNELIGIEVKASTAVAQNDLVGLRALAQDRRFKRGYIVYLGSDVVRFSDKICAIPVSALWDRAAFQSNAIERKPIAVGTKETMDNKTLSGRMTVDANIFLSYTHADNEHLDNAMVDFARALVEEYEFEFGATLQLFIDSESIQWGDNWRREITQGLEDTHFFMPCITPRYLLSEACRSEFLQFLGKTTDNSNCRILSLIWKTPPKRSNDQVLAAVERYQHKDVSGLRDLPSQSPEYKRAIRTIAEELHRIVEENLAALNPLSSATSDEKTQSDNGEPSKDLTEIIDEMTETMPQFDKAAEELENEFGELSTVFTEMPFPSSPSSGYTKWAISFAAKVQPILARLDANTSQINETWTTCYELMSGYISIGKDLGMDTSNVLPTLYSIRQRINPSSFAQIAEATNAFPKLSSRLRPLAQSIQRLIGTFQDISEMTDTLISEAESAASNRS